MKKEELSPERTAVERLTREIHEANVKYERYTTDEIVTLTWRVPYRIGPVTLPNPFYKKYQGSTKKKVFSITPSSNTVIMVEDGWIALKNPKTGRYNMFDFRTGSSDDFHTVKAAIEKWRRIPQNIHFRD